ncbi:MAG: serine acetyltransferase [Sedimentisphaerales bacterium]|nr:serine acetyltransferase [Sedimentisphaerales bacterium]
MSPLTRFTNDDAICLISKLEDSYFALPRIQHISKAYLPSRPAIYGLIDRLFGVLFPGFFGPQDLTRDNIKYHIINELQELNTALARQISQCMSLDAGGPSDAIEHQAVEATYEFLLGLPRLRALLATDVLAGYQGDPAAANTDEVVFSYPATIAIATHRMAHIFWNLKVPLMPRIMTEHAHSRTGIDIHPGATIGPSFFIDHGTGVVIGETTVIGERCKLYQGVTLGALSFPHDDQGQIHRQYKRHPTLEDEVVVYANATILGDVTIGKAATVGGGVFLTRSVPPGCTVSNKAVELKYRNRPNSLDRGYTADWQI